MRSDVRRELEAITHEVATERPELAERLARIADRLPSEVTPASEYISTGEAAAALGVSVNTVKKWVRTGAIRDFWTLPGSGYIKVSRSELARIRAGRDRDETPR